MNDRVAYGRREMREPTTRSEEPPPAPPGYRGRAILFQPDSSLPPCTQGGSRGVLEHRPIRNPKETRNRSRLAVLIVAKDEADNLDECLATVAWADEMIVVVDQASRDATLQIARRRAGTVIARPFDDFASQRNAGLDLATTDWVLSIDADERVTPELKAEILGILGDPAPRVGAYRIPIRSRILGRRFAYSGTQHDLPTRLFRRTAARWTGLVHETLTFAGETGTLRGELTHRTIPDMRIFINKINHYTSLEARSLVCLGRRYRTRDLLCRPVWTFLKLYLGKQGFRDGLEGLIFCAMSGVSAGVRAWKHRELLLRDGEGA
jgi:glycosyltransferase involved in cell wall biosynthesis